MTQTSLPAARAAFIDKDGRPAPQFYRFLESLATTQVASPTADDVAAINAALAKIDATLATSLAASFPTLLAQMPLKSMGLLQNGFAKLVWAGTTSDVPEGSRLYFTDPRVYAAVKAMLAGSALVSVVADDASQTVTIETKAFEFDQPTPSTEWSIAHNLGKFPSVSVVDSAGHLGLGSTRYVDSNNVILSFAAPFAGKAYLN